MIRRILAAASLVMLSTTAFAADLLNYKPAPLMSPAPAFGWTGFHLGVVVGYAIDGNDAKYSYNNVPSPAAIPLLPKEADLTSKGWERWGRCRLRPADEWFRPRGGGRHFVG